MTPVVIGRLHLARARSRTLARMRRAAWLWLVAAAGCAGGAGLSGGPTGTDGATTAETTTTTTGPEATGAPTTGGTCPEGQVCGGCPETCPDGQVCVDGACVAACPDGQVMCGDGCVDTQTDAAHCGGCDMPCEPGEACAEAICGAPCGDTELLCDGACVDPKTSDAHCGGCGAPCPGGVACVQGECTHFDVGHVLITGQSLSNGYGSAALSTMQLYTHLSFNTGVRAGADGLTGFIPLVETWDGAHGETIASGLSNQAASLWEAAGYTRPDLLVSAHGVDGARYELIKKGTASYTAGLAQMTAGHAIAGEKGLSYAVRAVTVIHGESDHNDFKGTLGNPNYAAHLIEWRGDYEADAQAITGQTAPVVMFYCQVSSWTAFGTATSTIPGQQWQVAREQPDRFALVGPKYFLPYVDGVHLTGDGTRWLGEYYGKAYSRVFREGQPWRPLAPSAATRLGTAVTVEFAVPAPPLVLDTMAVADPGNYGFEFVDGSMSPPAITAVELTGPSQVTLTLAGEPTGPTPVVRYAYTGAPGAAAGAMTGPRGNLRDSDATPSLYGYALYNWAIHFEIAVQ